MVAGKNNLIVLTFLSFLSCSIFVINDCSEDAGSSPMDAGANEGYCERGDPTCTSSSAQHRLHRLPGGQENHVETFKLKYGQEIHMKTLSVKPLVFEIKNFLSPEECQHFIDLSHDAGLRRSETVSFNRAASRGVTLRDTNGDKRLSLQEMRLTIEDSFDVYPDLEDIKTMYDKLDMDLNHDEFITPDELGNTSPELLEQYVQDLVRKHPHKHSRFSKQAWLYPDQSQDDIFIQVQDRITELTQLPKNLIKKSDFQVVNYGVGGHYNAHHDSNPIELNTPCCTRQRKTQCRLCRYMTILFYLNDVESGGGTAFPIAGNSTYDEQSLRVSGNINLYNHCDKANLVVNPEKGKAVIWYNHYVDEKTGWLGRLDEFTWHGGCPVIVGEKWIANFWIKTTDDRNADLELK